jgi:hypothetical protein
LIQKLDKIQVQIKYKDTENTFEGTVEEAWLVLAKFFNEFIPSFEIAHKLWLNVEIQVLAKDCEGLIVFSPEGTNILAPKNKLTDNETLTLWLLAAYLGHKLNLLNSDVLSKEEMQEKLGKSIKITSTRLGELVKNEWIGRTEGDMFRITTFGVTQMQKTVIPRIKAKQAVTKSS